MARTLDSEARRERAVAVERPVRALIVDADALVRSALERSFARDRDRLVEAEFADSGEAALERMASGDLDVLVADVQLPGMTGAELLREARRGCPTTVRIALSGGRKGAVDLGVLPVAHLVLHKPASFSEIRDHIVRAGALRQRLDASGLSALIGRGERLPRTPQLHDQLTTLMVDETTSLGRIAGVVEQDPAIAARLLQLANSAWVGLPRRVGTTRDALMVLGLDLLRKLVLIAEVFDAFERLPEGIDQSGFQRHSVMTARIAGKIVRPNVAAAATTAALLHDVGKLALAVVQPEQYAKAVARSRASRTPLHRVERELLGFDHADAGAALMELWGLPLQTLHAVGDHHSPERLRPGRLDAPGAVFIANALANAVDENRVWEFVRERGGLDARWASRFPEETWTRWGAVAERVALEEREEPTLGAD